MTLNMIWRGPEATARARHGAERGLYLGAEHVLEESSRQVPLDEGTLFESGVASQEGMAAMVSYDTVYACRQHEELTWFHGNGRKAKYLEDPINDPGVKAKVEQLIAREILKALGG